MLRFQCRTEGAGVQMLAISAFALAFPVCCQLQNGLWPSTKQTCMSRDYGRSHRHSSHSTSHMKAMMCQQERRIAACCNLTFEAMSQDTAPKISEMVSHLNSMGSTVPSGTMVLYILHCSWSKATVSPHRECHLIAH